MTNETDRPSHILIVDDDEKITQLMEKFLSAYGFAVSTSASGIEMFAELAKDINFELIILDVMLPGDDGFELLRKLRQTQATPVIMLTAVGEDTERIMGLVLGADDYLTKPFNPHELLARIKAILRRGELKSTSSSGDTAFTTLEFQGWVLEKLQRRLVSPEGIEVALTDGEYRLLEAFAERPNEVLSRDDLLEITQNRQAGPFDRSIDVRISRLRQKLEPDAKQPVIIKTVRGGGYIFATKVERGT